MKSNQLRLRQLNSKLLAFSVLKNNPIPKQGWMKTIRMTLGMTLEQLGNRISKSKQSVLDMERREREGSITLNALREAAHGMDMELVYGFVPKDGNLENTLEKRARVLATEIVMRTSQTMKLEDQEISTERLKQAIEARTQSLLTEMPKILWEK